MTGREVPEATVVIATRNRAARLRALIESVLAQEGVRHELVVVDDGSTDDTPAVLAEAGARGAVTAIRHESPAGPAVARNAGWRAARAALVVFVDDDCVAEPGWLSAMLAAHRAGPEAVIQGRTEPHPAEVHKHSAFSRSMLVDGPNNWFQTCNIAYPRALLERIGGFDEAFRYPAGEDTDLAWRAKRAGASTRYEDDACVLHAVHTLGAVRIARAARRWEDTVLCVKRYPELRADYRMWIFWKPGHQRLFFAALGLVLARCTRGLSLLLALPYVTYYRSQHGSYAGTLTSMPGHVLVDGAETAAMVRGSVRYRTFVL